MSFKEIAQATGQLEKELGISFDDVLHKLTQEVGEFNDAVQKYRGHYCRKRVEVPEVEKEIGDIMMNLVSILYHLGINPDDLQKYAQNTLESFEERKEEYSSAIGEVK